MGFPRPLFFIETAVVAASSLIVRINGNKLYHICTDDCRTSCWSHSAIHVIHSGLFYLWVVCQCVSAHSCAGIIPTCWGLFAKIRRRRPGCVKCSHHASLHAWAAHAHSSSPHYRLSPSHYLSHAHTLVSCFSFCVCISLTLCDLSVYVWPFCCSAPANDGTGIAGVLH